MDYKELKQIKTEKQIGCEYCDDDGFCPPLDWKYGLDHIFPDYKYCPMCGKNVRKEGKKIKMIIKSLSEFLRTLGPILTLVFVSLRACDVVLWNWFWVLSPLIICEIMVILLYAIKGVGNSD